MAKRKVSPKTAPVQTAPSLKTPRINFKVARVVVIVVAVLAALYFLKSYFIAAVVNGQPIFRTSVVSQLEAQGGKQTLDSLISKNLLLQEAKKRHISVTTKEVDQEIAKLEGTIKKQGGTLDQVLQVQGISRVQLREQVYVQKLLEKMFAKDTQVSDQEVAAFLEQNKSAFPQGIDSPAVKAQAKQQVQQNKLGKQVQALLQELKAKAKIYYFVQYPSSALPPSQ